MPEWKPMGVRAAPAPRRIARAMLQAVYALYLCTGIATLPSAALRAEPAAALAPTTLAADIPSQPLAQALEDFGRQTGLQVVWVSGVVGEQQTRGAPAGMPLTETLSRLLEGTGLRFEFLNGRIVRIFVNDAPLPVLEEVLVIAHHIPKPYIAPPTKKEQQTLEAADADLEAHIAREHLLYGHAALDRYAQGVAEHLLAVEGVDAGTVHVRVIKGLDANAFALSNGAIYLTTAILATLDDESQLAAVLGHELTHYTSSHALRGLREESRSELVARTTGSLLNVAVALVERHNHIQNSRPMFSPQDMEIWARAAISGYSRDLERQADEGGIRRMIAAGYDSSGALAALKHLAEQTAAAPAKQPPMYASHPRVEERIASYRDLLAGELAAAAGIGETRRGEYRAQLAELRLDQVAMLVEAGALDRAERLLEAEIGNADTARAEFLKGEIARKRVPQTDATIERALAAYERAVGLPDAPVSAYREAGLLQRLRGESAAAVVSFQDYLERVPTAVDAPLVRIYLDELRTSAPVPEAHP
jgi:predicted Zn-dependent protease